MATHEPEMHRFLTGTFVALPSAGSLPAAEILVLDLFREIFFDDRSESKRERSLDPNEIEEQDQISLRQEQALLYMLMGRKRSRRNSQNIEKPFFAPAYPYLARNSWLEEQRKRIIYQFFLRGPLAQHLWQRGDSEENRDKQQKLSEVLIETLSGSRNTMDSMYISIPPNDHACNQRIKAIERVKQRTIHGSHLFKLPSDYDMDELSTQIYQDLYAICDLEKDIPRMQWMQIFIAFLRFSIPIWLLAQMELTITIYNYIYNIYEEDIFPNEREIIANILNRNKGMITPYIEYSRDLISNKIEEYMKCKIKLNILLEELERLNMIPETKNKKLTLSDNDSSNVALIQFLSYINRSKSDFSAKVESEGYRSIRNLIHRKSEAYSAFYTPTKSGQGENIRRFFQILYKGHTGEYFGGYLLSGQSGSFSGKAKIFPGHGLIKMILFLALKNKRRENPNINTKNLVLEDIETHFSKYGIDFTKTAETRNLLMTSLKDMGLLTGSPDAGSSVAVACPFQGG